MSRITCKECGKVWINREAYDEDPGCDRGWCLNTKEGTVEMARRKRNRPPHIRSDNAPFATESVSEGGVEQVLIQVHQTRSMVLTKSELLDGTSETFEVIVPDAININIFPRKGNRK